MLGLFKRLTIADLSANELRDAQRQLLAAEAQVEERELMLAQAKAQRELLKARVQRLRIHADEMVHWPEASS